LIFVVVDAGPNVLMIPLDSKMAVGIDREQDLNTAEGQEEEKETRRVHFDSRT
jgi:hypothetical protein